MKGPNNNKLFIAITYIAIASLTFAPAATAQELTVTGNGDNSTNNIQVTENNQTNVQQTNTANITNDVQTNANTGNNTASNNAGEANNIQTGDTSATVNVTNTANASIVNQPCCPESATNTNISGNGTGSQNNATVSSDSQTTVTINQTANITTNIKETANTGNNQANNNTGNVTIHTGDITSTKHLNTSENLAHVSIPSAGDSGKTTIKIENNGADSTNTVTLKNNNNTKITINNQSQIQNIIESIFNTGNNTANANTGDVTIRTGDIISALDITSETNTSKVKLDCCTQDPTQPADPGDPQHQDPPPTLPVQTNPITPTSTSSANPPGQTGQVAGASASAPSGILPATGNNWLLFALLSNLIMLFLGGYLRLRSGNSPGFTFAI